MELEIIQGDESALYRYGLVQGFFMVMNLITIVVIGLVAGMLWQSLLFMVVYLPLRSFAGGYHARSQFLCYLYSAILIASVLMIIRFFPWTPWITFGVALLSSGVIFILSPVEDRNKPLDPIEVKTYGERTKGLLILNCVLFLLAFTLRRNAVAVVMAVSLLALSMMLILGRMKLALMDKKHSFYVS